MGSKWPYSYCFMEYYFQNLFNIACSILVQFPSRFLYVLCQHPCGASMQQYWHYCCLEKSSLILLDWSNFHMIDKLSISVHAFAGSILKSLSAVKTLLPRYMNLSISFRGLPSRLEIFPSQWKHIYSILFEFTWWPMPPAVCSRLCSRDLAWVGVFARSAISSA